MATSGQTWAEREYTAALLVLTAATGAVDGVSYLALDRVFTGNMTGNVLFIGFGLMGVQGIPVLNNLVALLTFLLGAALGLAPHAARVGRGGQAAGAPPWRCCSARASARWCWPACGSCSAGSARRR